MTFVPAQKAAAKWAKIKAKELGIDTDEQTKVAPKASGRKRAEPAKKNAKPSK